MLLAELDVYHSRPIAPTRRVAIGRALLPCDPAPGFGGILLGAIVARFAQDIDPGDLPDLLSLTHELEAGRRIPQPRLRHRFQQDRVGLTRSPHRLHRDSEDDSLRLSFTTDKGAPAQHVLGAVYAATTIDAQARGDVLASIRRGLAWTGDIGPSLLAHLAGRTNASLSVAAIADPVGWAMNILGFSVLDDRPDQGSVRRNYRDAMLVAHPDHGGDTNDAARRIADISEARRILLAR